VRYADGVASTSYVGPGRIGNWWSPVEPPAPTGIPTCKVAWRGKNGQSDNIGVFVTGFNVERPDVAVEEIVLDAAKDGTRWFLIGANYCTAPVFFQPRETSFGIPDGWGAGAVSYALVEGLAGVKDVGRAFDRVLLAPRWAATKVKRAGVVIRYPASEGYVAYTYRYTQRGISILCTGCAGETALEVLVPGSFRVGRITVAGTAVKHSIRTVEKSAYVCILLQGPGPHVVRVEPRRP